MCKGDNKAEVRDNSEKKNNDASEKLQMAASAQGSQAIPESQLSKVNVTTIHSSEGDVHSYPNGLKVGRLNDNGLDHSIDPPPGGSSKENKDGSVDIRDAQGKKIAHMDKDLTLHVYTKYGEYTEKADGSVTFKPAAGRSDDLSSLHKTGSVEKGKYEDYGISTDGKITRFPNGIQVDRAGNVTMPSEYASGGSIQPGDKRGDYVGYDKDGKVVFKQKDGVIHIPTADGEFTVTNGKIKFESKANKQAVNQGYLPEVQLV